MKPRPWKFVSEGRQLEHYADRGSPPDWRCRAALPHACTVFDPGRLDASLKPPCRTTVRPTGASVRRELPIVVGPGTAIGKLALTSAFPHDPPSWGDDDGQEVPTGTTVDDLGNRLRPGRSSSEHDRAATTQVSRNGLWAPVQHGQERLPGTPGSGLPGLGAGSGSACRTRFGRASPTTPPRPGGYPHWRPVRDPGRSASGPPRRSGRARAWCVTPPWQASR
jgi:hypothetical protein